jgi:acyl-CoA thioester hydrolase
MNLPTTLTPIQIRFSDLDPLGHVSNNAYSEYLEQGRVGWLDAIAGERPSVVVASLKIDFLRELRLRDEIAVATRCIRKGSKSLVLLQEIFRGAECVTRAEVVIVGFDLKTRQSMVLLDGWEPS